MWESALPGINLEKTVKQKPTAVLYDTNVSHETWGTKVRYMVRYIQYTIVNFFNWPTFGAQHKWQMIEQHDYALLLYFPHQADPVDR